MLLLFGFVLLMVILKVFYVQIFDYKKLSSLASDLWSRNLPIEASRGRILDRNGIVLADNVTTTSLVLVPNQIKNKKEVCEKLAEILNVSYDETGSIGKRYRRNDEIGTPFCVTVDEQSTVDHTFTIRYRDTMEQERLTLEEIRQKINQAIRF